MELSCETGIPEDFAADDVQQLRFVVRQNWTFNSREHPAANAFELAWPQPTQAQMALRAARQQTGPMHRTTCHQFQIPMCFNKPC